MFVDNGILLCRLAALLWLCFATVKAQAISVNVAWDRSTDSTVTGYKVYYGIVQGVYTSSLAGGNVLTSATISNLNNATRYWFVVVANNSSGVESPNSNEISYLTPALMGTPFLYDFSTGGTISQPGASGSANAYWWVISGGGLFQTGGVGTTFQGMAPATNYWRIYYATQSPVLTDTGTHPQNIFAMLLRQSYLDISEDIYVRKNADNLANAVNKQAYNGVSLYLRYTNYANFYYVGIRCDGNAIIKKRVNGIYQTMASKKVLPGTYDLTTSPDLIPTGVWIGLRAAVATQSSGIPKVSLSLDIGRTGLWTLAIETLDDPVKYGPKVASAGMVGIRTDLMDMSFDDFSLADAPGSALGPALLSPQSYVEKIKVPTSPTGLRIVKPEPPK
ncbi:MAG: hypothetical protein QOG91_605 [Candidatus Parcubacteria bacterium]|jgi:hypothetical protein|nr:hypothetical protein [Candidatus Parcubacteria bacterium]